MEGSKVTLQRKTDAWVPFAVQELASSDSGFVSYDLDYILERGYHPSNAVEQAYEVFGRVCASAQMRSPVFLPRLAIWLTESVQRDISAPSIDALQQNIHESTPPSIYLQQRSWRMFLPWREEFRLPLEQDRVSIECGKIDCFYECVRTLEDRANNQEFYRRIVWFNFDSSPL